MCVKAITLCGAALRRRADGRCHQYASLVPRCCAARWINAAHRSAAVRIGASRRNVRGQATLTANGDYERRVANKRCFACAHGVPTGFAAVRIN